MRLAAAAVAATNILAIGNDADALRAHAGQIDVAAPNWYSIGRGGRVLGDVGSYEYERIAHFRRPELWPVVNARLGFEGRWLTERPGRVARRVARIARRFDGVTLDIEEIPPRLRRAYSGFVADVARRARGRGVAVYVVRRTAEPPTRSAAAYDWRALGRSADLVLASTYGEHYPGGPPGPLTTPGGFADVLAHARATAGTDTVAPVLAGFGIAWPALGGRPGEVVSSRGLPQRSQTVRRDGEIIWFSRAKDLRARRAAAARAGFRWVALFSLGREPSGFWRAD